MGEGEAQSKDDGLDRGVQATGGAGGWDDGSRSIGRGRRHDLVRHLERQPPSVPGGGRRWKGRGCSSACALVPVWGSVKLRRLDGAEPATHQRQAVASACSSKVHKRRASAQGCVWRQNLQLCVREYDSMLLYVWGGVVDFHCSHVVPQWRVDVVDLRVHLRAWHPRVSSAALFAQRTRPCVPWTATAATTRLRAQLERLCS